MKELKAINDIVADKLTTMEQAALARMLDAAIREEKGENTAYTEYMGAADFLWMAFRITDEEKTALLALTTLIDAEGWWQP